MFSLQAPQLYNSLVSAGASNELAAAIMDAIGNCSQPLEHRGPITLDSPTVPQYPDTAPDSAFPTAGNALNVAPGSMIYGSDGGVGINISRPSLFRWDGIVQLNSIVIFGPGGIVRFFGPIVFGPGVTITYTTPPTMTTYLTSLPIGFLMFWDTTLGAIPAGWSAVGTAGDYLRIAASHNTSGGSLNTAKAVTGISIASHSPHTHAFGSIAVADHPAHTHSVSVPLDTCFTAVGTGTFASSTAPVGVTSGNPSAPLTHTVSGVTDTENAGLTHPVTEPDSGNGHLHTILPTFRGVVLIRKNS